MPRSRRRRLARQRRKHGVQPRGQWVPGGVWSSGIWRALAIHAKLKEFAVADRRRFLELQADHESRQKRRRPPIESVAFMPREQRKRAERMLRRLGAQ